MSTSRKVAVWAVVLLAVAIVLAGLYGVLGPVEHVSAAGRLDTACMRALKARHVPYERRVRRCRVRTTTGLSSAADGYWRWRTGNTMWLFWTEVTWSPRRVDYADAPVWRIDDVRCWVDHVYVVSLNIKSCGRWRTNGVDYGGAVYETGFGPVTFGERTYIIVRPDGTYGGIYYD